MLSETYFTSRGVTFRRTWDGITASGPRELEPELRDAVLRRMSLVQQMPASRGDGLCDGCRQSLPIDGQSGICVLCCRAREKVLHG